MESEPNRMLILLIGMIVMAAVFCSLLYVYFGGNIFRLSDSIIGMMGQLMNTMTSAKLSLPIPGLN